MFAKFNWVILLSAVFVISCSETDRDQTGRQVPPRSESPRAPAYVLQPGEGEVLFGGPRGGKVIIKVDPEKTGSPQMAMGIQYLVGGVPVHKHEQEEEVFFVHAGQGVGIVGEERIPLQPGTTMYIPPGTWHGFEPVEGDDETQVLWIVTPGSGETTQLDKFFRETRAPAGEEPKTFTPEQFEDILRKHGQVPKEPVQ